MVSYMRIVVTVAANQAQAQLARLRGGVASLNGQIMASNKMTPLGSTHLRSLNMFGNKLQWTGRMLMYNFTLPIVAAGVAAMKFAMDNEKAMTHVAKVYGDTRAAAAQFRKESHGLMTQMQAEAKARRIARQELVALDGAFTAISNHYGVQKKEVLEVAGAWAAAGVSGRALADSVNLTMKAIIIGDMDATKATESLIAIQGQFNLSTKELNATLATMNSIENSTAASMTDLIDAFARSAGMARQAGVSVKELSAMVAALVPATGSAAAAGNALKTLLSRLVAPTKEASQVMQEMGLNTTAMSWANLNATERLKVMAREFNGLHKAQQNVAASVIASRWQVNRFAILMEQIVDPTGRYAQALHAAEDQGYNFTRMQKELNTVLKSDPRALTRLWVEIQNAMSKAIIPIIPHILYLVNSLAKMAQAFADLSPETQKFIMYALLILAAIGPIVRYIGALTTLYHVLAKSVTILAFAFSFLAKMILGPVVAAFMGIGGIVMTAMGAVSGVLTAWFVSAVGIFSSGMAWILGVTVTGWARISAIWLLESAFTTNIYVAAWSTIRGLTIAGWAMLSGKFVVGRAILITMWAAQWAAMVALTAISWEGIIARTVLGFKALVATIIASGPAIRGAVLMVGRFILGPWGLAIMAAIALIVAFKDQIAIIWHNIIDGFKGSSGSINNVFTGLVNGILNAFHALPQGVQDVMVAVVSVIHDAAIAVYNWFSYLNPWATHSPSLVDNVTTGMDRVMSEFSKLSGVKRYTDAAYAEIKRFGNLTAGLTISASQQQQKEDRRAIKKSGGGAAAINSYNKLQGILATLNGKLDKLEGKITKQQKVVDRWQGKVDQANKKLKEQQDILDKLGEKVDKWQGKLDDANNRLQTFANTPIKGMRAMEDAIFANDMATKRMRLSMMSLEDVYGTFDDIKSKIDSINGAQEMISGQKAELRAAGAGSDILKNFDDQLAGLNDQRDAYQEQADKISGVQKQLDALARQAERLDLTKSITFDPLLRQIDQVVNAVQEMSFDDIMAGIKDAQGDVALYTDKLNEANAAYAAQQVIVDQATAARDRLQATLDAEQAKLDTLKTKYDKVNEAIQAIESTINDVISAAEKMNEVMAKADAKKKKKAAAESVSPGLQAFRDAGQGDFPDVGGSGMPPRKDWSSQVDSINKFTDDLAASTADLFANINPFKPLMAKAKNAWEWIKDKAKQIIPEIGNIFAGIFDGVGDDGKMEKIGKSLKKAGEWITGVLKDIGKMIKFVADLIGPELKAIALSIWEGLKGFWETVGPKLGELGKALAGAWPIIKIALEVIGGVLAWFVKGILGGVAKSIGPFIDTIGDVLGGFIDILTGVFQIITGIFTLNGSLIWDGIKNVFGGAFDAIYGIIKAPIELAYNFIIGFFHSLYDGAVWLYDQLIGHSVIPDIVDGIVACFKPLVSFAGWIWDHILKPVYEVFVKLWNWVKPALAAWWEGIKAEFKALWAFGKWVWDNILQPVFGWVKSLWVDYVKDELALWWERLKTAWTILWTLAQWVWTNILKPVFDGIKALWTDYVKPELGLWWERLKNVWDALTGLGVWIKNNVMDPVFNAFKTGWTDIKEWFEKNADFLTKPVNAVVNGAISGVNFLIKGLNKISDVLPGIDFTIATIPTLARGGAIPERRVNGGFRTNGARAIVGEGKANYPEYVIPTDPTHRRRSVMLLHEAAKRVGITSSGTPNPGGEMYSAGKALAGQPTRTNLDGVPMYGIGGVIGGWVKDAVGTVTGSADWLVNKGRNMASFLADPFFNMGRSALDGVGWVVPREIGKYGLDQAQNWIDGVDQAFNDIVKDQILGGKGVQDAVAFAKSQVGKPYVWGGVGPDGYDCSGFMSALTNVIRGNSPFSRVGSTASFPWNGFAAGVGPRAGFTIGSTDNYSGGIGHMAGTLAGMNVESAGGVGVRVGASARGYNDPGFNTRAYLAMKEGGVALRRSGGTPIVAGDGRYDEAVVPLPKDWRAGGGSGEKHYHFYGNMEFPNVNDGDDAESFLNNLDNLAKD